MMNEERWIVKIGTDVRECRLEGGVYIHVLHSGWKVAIDDPQIDEVKQIGETHA